MNQLRDHHHWKNRGLKCPSLLRDESGFTLVEVLVASAIFVGVFLMVTTLLARATTDYLGRRVLTATQLAQAEMEDALGAGTLEPHRATIRENGITWDILTDTHTATGGLWSIEVRVIRHVDSTVYATLWTQVYRPAVYSN